MHKFPDVKPAQLGLQVTVHLASGGSLQGYWDGLQWWCGVDGQDADVPVENSFVVGWSSELYPEN